MSRYHSQAIEELKDQQVRFAPREVRLAQMRRAENLVHELDADKTYRYGDICRRVTNTKVEPTRHAAVRLKGDEVIHDLRCFVEDLSESIDMSPETVGEPVFTVKDLAKRFNVSSKTVDRWRDRGLVSRRFRFGNRKQIGFLKSSVERFIERNAEDVRRGTSFGQIDEKQREQIVRVAREMVRSGLKPTEICQRLGKRFGRSAEAIRYTLKKYDQEHPENAVFPSAKHPLTDEQKALLLERYRAGVPLDQLAKQFRRTKGRIRAIINEMRYRELLENPIEYIDSPEFHKRNADKVILGPPPQVDKPQTTVKVPPGLPAYLASLYEVPLLTREEEQYYFRKMNYLKYKAARLVESFKGRTPTSRQLDEVEDLLRQSLEIKNFLIRSNLRLVVSIAKRHVGPGQGFFEMVSDGNMSLIRAIEKFDYTRGNKFSTYASWAIMKNYARSIPTEVKHRDRFRTGIEEVFQQSKDERENAYLAEIENRQQSEAIKSILDTLDDRERKIIEYRFGLNYEEEPKTLEQVGKEFGVTKERIRQLEARALRKLRNAVEERKLDIPGV